MTHAPWTFCGFMFVFASFAAADFPIIPVAYDGQPAPGTNSMFFRLRNSDYDINSNGDLIFRSETQTGSGVWFGRPGELSRLANSNAPSSPPLINDAGQVAFASYGGLSQVKLWTGFPSALSRVNLADNQVYYEMNENGQVAFWQPTAIYRWSAGVTETIAAVGELAPGSIDNLRYEVLLPPRINDAGQSLYSAWLTGDSRCIWMGIPGQTQPVAQSGQSIPDMPGTRYTNTDSAITSPSSGRIAFRAWDESNTKAIWAGPPGNLERVVTSSDPAPGFVGLDMEGSYPDVMNDRGDIAFRSYNGGYEILWLHTADGLRHIAHGGQQAPGAPDGVFFADGGFSNNVLSLNELGHLAFSAVLRRNSPDVPSKRGIWVSDDEGHVAKIMSPGDSFVLDGQMRIVDTINHTSAINNADQVLFVANFTDGTSALLLAAVPEPASLALVAAGLCLLTRRGRN